MDQDVGKNGVISQSGEPTQVLLDTLPHIAFIIKPGGHAEYYNQRFVDYIGFRPGADKASRTALQHPDDQPHLEAVRESGAASKSEYIIEARLRRHDGAYRWHRIHNKPFFADRRLLGWLGTAVDIHDVREANEVLEERVRQRASELEAANQQLTAEIVERKRIEMGLRDSEARYRMLYDRTPMALQSVDAEARLLDVNETWLTMFGYEREQVIGRSPVDFMTAESVVIYQQQAWPEMLDSRAQVRTVDYQFVTRSGDIFDGRLAARGEFDLAGRFVRSWSAIADVTAEKRADRDLRQAQRLEAVGQLSAGIAHDFNNLLTAVIGNLELLSQRLAQDDTRAARFLAGARTAAERGARLTTQLLAFSRQQRIVATPVDPSRVIHGMFPLLQSTIGGLIGIKIIAEPGLWTALADVTQLEMAVLNLTINARDAMPQSGMISIAIENVSLGQPTKPEEPAAGDYVSIAVSDTGSGMPNEVREKIFEPFFTTKEVGKGSGLGLPQVLGAAKQLGGGIAVRSTPGEGTCVTLFLPRSRKVLAAEPEGLLTSERKAILRARKSCVLLVDDDAEVLTVAGEMLRNAGYDVVEASSGGTALDALHQPEMAFNLLVVDFAMPGMNGGQLAAMARRIKPALPILFMTGHADASLLPASAGQDVLSKPFRSSDLLAKVEWAMAKDQTNGEL